MRCCAERLILIVIVLLAGTLLFAQTVQVPSRPSAYATAPDIRIESVPNFFKLPTGIYLGENAGVATNSKGHVFVYTRSRQTRLFEFDQNGKYVREIGEGNYAFQRAHAVRVDAEDNIWTVDEGTNLVIKFNPEGQIVMTIGHRPESSDELSPRRVPSLLHGTPVRGRPAERYLFSRPTDIAWDAAGNIFVADGYGNSRVAKYDKTGIFLTQAESTPGNGPDQFDVPHTIATDASGNVYVGDLGNRRIKVFSNDLKLLRSFDHIGAPVAICITAGPRQYLYTSNSNPGNHDSRFMNVTGEIYKMELDGTVVGKFGKPGKLLGEFSTTHMIDCRNENRLFIAELTSWRVQKIILHPTVEGARK